MNSESLAKVYQFAVQKTNKVHKFMVDTRYSPGYPGSEYTWTVKMKYDVQSQRDVPFDRHTVEFSCSASTLEDAAAAVVERLNRFAFVGGEK